MKIIKEVSNFFIVFTFYSQYNFEKVMEMNHVRDCISDLLSKCDHIDENIQIKVLDVIDDIVLMVIDRNVENLVQEIKIF